MFLTFFKPTELDVYNDNSDDAEPTSELFKEGEIIDVDIFDDRGDGTISIQFGNGDVVYGIPKALFAEDLSNIDNL